MRSKLVAGMAVLGALFAAPVAAHHNAILDVEIGDAMDQHENAIETLDPLGEGSIEMSMDPADDANAYSEAEQAGEVDLTETERTQGGSLAQDGTDRNPQGGAW
jgi:hypothetical protein